MKKLSILLIKSFLIGLIIFTAGLYLTYNPPYYEIPEDVYQNQKNIYMLDIGHGYREGERCGKYKSVKDGMGCYYEYQFNAAVVEKLAQLLNEKNIYYIIIDTLYEQRDMHVNERVEIINKIAKHSKVEYAPILFSVHANASSSNPNATGFEVFTNFSKCGELIDAQNCEEQIGIVANRLASNLERLLDIPLRDGGNDRLFKLSNRAHEGDIAILKNTVAYAYLIEGGFYTNKEELKKLKSKEFQFKVASAIYETILEIENLEK